MGPAEALPIGWELARALRLQWAPPEALRARQLRALRAQLRHAAGTVPYYRRRVWAARVRAGAWPEELAQLAELPTISRAHIQAQPDAFLAEGQDRGRWRSSHTSGSTGRPLHSSFDPACWRQVKYVLKARRLMACGWRPGDRVAIIDALPREALAAHARAQGLGGWLGRWQYLSVFEPPQQHRADYLALRPHYLYGFPSYVLALAELWDERLRASIPLKGLMTSGEWTHPAVRRRLEEAFGVPVWDVYGSTECKEIAWECPAGSGYHVNMESVVVELVDERGQPVPEGESGEVVVTTLTNRAMPLIRYRMGDRARRLPGPCPCGRGLERLEALEGRVAEYLEVPGLGMVSPYELTTLIEAHPGVLRYQVTYRPPEALHVQVVLRRDEANGGLEAIRQALERRFEGKVRVVVEAADWLPRAASGKARCVQVAAATATAAR